jgi:hypothetical protein
MKALTAPKIRCRILVASLAFAALALTSMPVFNGALILGTPTVSAAGKLDTPTLRCVESTQHTIFLEVCAGNSGAPAGFSIQWQKLPEGVPCGDFVWPASDDTRLCKASFSGVPGCSIYNLGRDACVTVEIGNLQDAECGVGLDNCGADELDCSSTYVFRAFAHNVPGPGGKNRSDFTANRCCSTEQCVAGCVFTQGYWKTHGPEGCNPSGGDNIWPVPSLTIGGTIYTDTDLCTNLNLPGGGNAVRILSHQLIAALLNIANGAAPPPDCDIDAASALLNGLDINTASVATSSTLGHQMTAAAACLDLYNNGDGGVTHCP